MLRATVIAVVGVMLAVTLACTALAATGIISGGMAFGVWGACQLAIILLGFVFERTRYKAVDPAPPAGFERTAERFVDPTTGQDIEVWFDPRTGERRYVAVSEAV